jgi:hypothetical protein
MPFVETGRILSLHPSSRPELYHLAACFICSFHIAFDHEIFEHRRGSEHTACCCVGSSSAACAKNVLARDAGGKVVSYISFARMFVCIKSLGVFQYFLSLYHFVSIFLSFPFLISNKSYL